MNREIRWVNNLLLDIFVLCIFALNTFYATISFEGVFGGILSWGILGLLNLIFFGVLKWIAHSGDIKWRKLLISCYLIVSGFVWAGVFNGIYSTANRSELARVTVTSADRELQELRIISTGLMRDRYGREHPLISEVDSLAKLGVDLLYRIEASNSYDDARLTIYEAELYYQEIRMRVDSILPISYSLDSWPETDFGTLDYNLSLIFSDKVRAGPVYLSLLLSIFLVVGPLFLLGVTPLKFEINKRITSKSYITEMNSTVLEKTIELHDILKDPVEQYLFLFKDFVKVSKGVELGIKIDQTRTGLRIQAVASKDFTKEDLADWLAEYTALATKEKLGAIEVPKDTVVKQEEIDLLILKLENQVAHLKNNLRILELKNSFLKKDNDYLKQLTTEFSKKDNVIHVQNISGGEQQFADKIENKKP